MIGSKRTGIALVILTVCAPIAAVMAIIAAPFCTWFEAQSGIEAIGHSGPAQWCCLVCYGLVVTLCTVVWSIINRETQSRQRR